MFVTQHFRETGWKLYNELHKPLRLTMLLGNWDLFSSDVWFHCYLYLFVSCDCVGARSRLNLNSIWIQYSILNDHVMSLVSSLLDLTCLWLTLASLGQDSALISLLPPGWSHLVLFFVDIHTLQLRNYHGYMEGNIHRQNCKKQWPARGIAALQISNTTINQLFRPYVK